MKYDDASFHYGGNFPKNLPTENAATHMGMLMAWAIEKDLIGSFHRENSAEDIEKIKQRKITGRDFVINICDEKLADEDFNDLGNRFLKDYYDKEYLDDYFAAVDPEDKVENPYLIENSWGNYDKLKPVLDKKFEEWGKDI